MADMMKDLELVLLARGLGKRAEGRLRSEIEAEAKDREAADDGLDGKITAEAKERGDKDAELDEAIKTEAEARETFDRLIDERLVKLDIATDEEVAEMLDTYFVQM